MGGMEVCQPPNAELEGVSAGGEGAAGGDPARASGATPGHRDRTLVYSTVGTPDYIAPEVCCWWTAAAVGFCNRCYVSISVWVKTVNGSSVRLFCWCLLSLLSMFLLFMSFFSYLLLSLSSLLLFLLVMMKMLLWSLMVIMSLWSSLHFSLSWVNS